MSGTEDYLDGLLDSMEGRKRTEAAAPEQESDIEPATGSEAGIEAESGAEGGRMSSEDEFLDSFEREFLSGDNTDEFIRQFEQELMEEEMASSGDKSKMPDDLFFEGVDGIVSSAREQMEAGNPLSDMDDDIMVDTIGDFPGDDIVIPDTLHEPSAGEASSPEPDISLQAETAPLDSEDGLADDDMDLMGLLQKEGDFSGIGDMLENGGEDTPLFDDGIDGLTDFGESDAKESAALDDAQEEGRTGAKKKRKEKKDKTTAAGLLQRISYFLFGEDEDEEGEQEQELEPVKAAAVMPSSIEEFSDENLEILQTLEGTKEPEEQAPLESAEDEAERKKREKQEKKEQAKNEKQQKKEQAKADRAEKKAQKVKKPKPPKEPDNTPPLPKKPVILIFVMVASFMALVLIGTDLFGYSSSFANAQREYGLGNYESAFAEVSGVELKEQDYDTYEKYRIMANAAGEYSAYQAFLQTGIYDMALDSLIRTVGRCDKYQADAQSYGCEAELANIRSRATAALATFGLTEERTLELYAMEERDTYSGEVYALLAAAGFAAD